MMMICIRFFVLSSLMISVAQAQFRPILFPNPSHLSADPFETMRATLLKKFDQNRDGFLDSSEREAIRKSTQLAARERIREMRKARENKGGKEESPPPRWITLYDENENGHLDGTEWETAFRSEIKRVHESFDLDESGTIDDTEKGKVMAHLKQSQLHPFDAYVHSIVAGFKDEGEEKTIQRWQDHDFDGDGKASLSELKSIRAAESQKH